jgi:hypothetical protein
MLKDEIEKKKSVKKMREKKTRINQVNLLNLRFRSINMR